MKQIGIYVGGGIGGQKEIINELRKEGYFTDCSYEQWPIDSWVYFNGKYAESGEVGVTGNVFWDGENVIFGKDFLLV